MGKEIIKMACGHEEKHDITGKINQRDYKAQKIAERVCAECAAKERNEHNALCAEENAKYGLPTLEGSEKQIAWAESIRNEVLSALIKYTSDSDTQKALAHPKMQEKVAGTIIDDRETYQAITQNILKKYK